MKIYHGIAQFHPPQQGVALSIGNFDGVHLGHKQVLSQIKREAHNLNVPSVVYTFHPHPFEVLFPQKPFDHLFDGKDQEAEIEKLGIDHLVIEKFTSEFAAIPANDFLEKIILKQFRPKIIVVGDDFNFGAGGKGTSLLLSEFCKRHEIGAFVVPEFVLHNVRVSSSRIREYLKLGKVAEANEFLGRDYYLRGKVIEGKKRGRQIGFPTANISPTVNIEPQRGVYFSQVKYNGQIYKSLTNIGYNPTFEKGKQVHIETHILHFDKEIYGEVIEVFLLKFHRGEIKFNGVEELVKQIKADVVDAMEFFNEKN